MKSVRWSALNWAFVALVAIVALYSVVSIFGTMPAFTVGGYKVPVSNKDAEMVFITMPYIGSQFWLIIVPFFAFTVRYFTGLVKLNPKEAREGTTAGTIGGTTFGMIGGAIGGTVVGVIGRVIGGTVVGTMGGTIGGKTFGTVVGTVAGTTFGTMQFLIYALFLTEHRGEWLMALPGITVVIGIVNAMLISALPLLIAVVERLASKTFWQSLSRFLGTASKATAPAAEH